MQGQIRAAGGAAMSSKKQSKVTDRELMLWICRAMMKSGRDRLDFIRRMEKRYRFTVLPKPKKKRTLKLVRA